MIRAECVAFANHKGGTGKTTSCLAIAGYLAKSGNKVLVVDFDPQASATSGLGIDPRAIEFSMHDAILSQCDGYEGVPMRQVILETKVENLHCAPSQFDLAIAEVLMLRNKHRATMLNRILEEVRPLYDYILIDLSPSSGLLTINGLCASDQVVVPLDPSVYSLAVLRNLKTTFSDIKQMAGHSINRISGVLIRTVKPNLFAGMFGSPNASQEMEAELANIFQALFLVPESTKIWQAQRAGLLISHYAPKSRVGMAYATIAKSIEHDVKEKSSLNPLETIRGNSKMTT